MHSNTGREYKLGLLVAKASVKGFDKLWSILIDSGASGNYVRSSSPEWNPHYVEALKGDTGNVRLATGTLVTAPKVSVNLGVKCFDFDSIERCLVLSLDSRYDLILRMAWLEHHEPWINWRSKALGATRTAPRGSLLSHETTSATN